MACKDKKYAHSKKIEEAACIATAKVIKELNEN